MSPLPEPLVVDPGTSASVIRRTRRGLLLMLAATAAFVGMSVCVKVLREAGLSTAEVIFFRTGPGLLWLWWTLQWPLLFGALLLAFAGILYLGPDVDHPRFRFITPGAVAAAALWIAGSALFGLYASGFSSYNKAWGSLSAVIVTLTWLWLCSVAVMFAAELNAELERTREIHTGADPAETLTARHK